MNPGQIELLKGKLATLKDKGWDDSVRIMDYHEISGEPLGTDCGLQIMDYVTGHWIETNTFGSLAMLYRVARITLRWDGAIRLAVGAA